MLEVQDSQIVMGYILEHGVGSYNSYSISIMDGKVSIQTSASLDENYNLVVDGDTYIRQ